MNDTDKQPVVISRYSDYTCTTKEYIVDSNNQVRCFVNKASAETFLLTALGIPNNQLDWFMYDLVHSCAECFHLELDASKMYVMKDKTICESCYYSPD